MNSEPLSSKLRPQTFDQFVGQKHLVGEKGLVTNLLSGGSVFSMIFWGPPGSGKTTLARLIAKETDSDFFELSAVDSGVKDIKKIFDNAKQTQLTGTQTILFLDEIHRFNKAQQDRLLPYVEDGTVTLIGATTENPSFGVIQPLLSRCRVLLFENYSKEDLEIILQNALQSEELSSAKVEIKDDASELLIGLSDGDPRFMLNTLEMAIELFNRQSKGKKQLKIKIDKSLIEQSVQKKALIYDRAGEEHYNLISALHKSMRSSDANATIYWLLRMLEAGEDPLYIARRLIRFASEDIGISNNNALLIANAAYEASKNIGMPECNLALMQAAVYLAKCPKDNRLYTASQKVKKDIEKTLYQPVPLHLRNAPTKLMKDIGYGKGYVYDHNVEGKVSGQQCLPDELVGRVYY